MLINKYKYTNVCFLSSCRAAKAGDWKLHCECFKCVTSRGRCSISRGLTHRVTTVTLPCCCRVRSGVKDNGDTGDGSSRQRRARSPGSDGTNARNPRPLQLLLHGRCPLQVGKTQQGHGGQSSVDQSVERK